MRKILCALLCLMPIICCASFAKITCYSKGKVIYSGYGRDIAYDGGTLFFKEKKTHHVMMTNADCIVSL